MMKNLRPVRGICIATTLLVLLAAKAQGQTVTPGKVLFDATKAQMAGNADWVVDADVNNVGTTAGGAMTPGAGSESNPQRFPTPPQSGITASTPENYWKGALSAWGVGLVKLGFSVETLPIGGRITFGDATNAQDLSNYGIYVIPEPNILFTLAEKQAIIRFVDAGGGLFMVGNHSGSDRNNDGFDPPEVYNDLFNNNGIAVNPFGIQVNPVSFSVIAAFPSNDAAADPILAGPVGTVSAIEYNSGASMTVSGAGQGALFRTATRSNSDVMFAFSTYGKGRVAMVGDSSPPDDGTGDTGDDSIAVLLEGQVGTRQRLPGDLDRDASDRDLLGVVAAGRVDEHVGGAREREPVDTENADRAFAREVHARPGVGRVGPERTAEQHAGDDADRGRGLGP